MGVISRSGTLTYEAVDQLTSRDIGQSTCIGIAATPSWGPVLLIAWRRSIEILRPMLW